MTEVAYNKPLPKMEGLTKEFYDWCRKRELRFQRCKQCGSFRHVPREVCAECSSFDWEWALSSGRGSIFTWTVVEHGLHPAFVKLPPFAPVVIEMEEGVRLLSQILDVTPDELKVGMPVQVAFKALTHEVTLPYFRKA